MSAVEPLDGQLQHLQTLKPPGASPTKITEITTLCVDNIQLEATIVQKIYVQFKKAPITHKLGVLYVVDSVTRQWMAKATQSGQKLAGATAPQGTFASGVHKMTEIIPMMMNELLSNYPQDQKVRHNQAPIVETARKHLLTAREQKKIDKLMDIWDQSNVLPKQTIRDFRTKLDPPAASTNDPGSHGAPSQYTAQLPTNTSTDTSSIIAALSSLGKPPGLPIGTNQQQLPQQPNQSNVANLPFGIPPPVMPQNVASPAQSFPAYGAIGNTVGTNSGAAPFAQSGNMIANPVIPPPTQPVQTAQPELASNPMAVQVLQGALQGTVQLEQASELLKLLGFPDQAGQVLQLKAYFQPGTQQVAPPAPPAVVAPNMQHDNISNGQDQSRQNGHVDSREYQRYRSRSPDRRASPYDRRGSPIYGTYDPSQSAEPGPGGRQDGDRRGKRAGRNRGGDYRQRSPPPQRRQNDGPRGSRNVEVDPTLPPGTIRVLSRTLFVGGVAASEEEVRRIFSQFGSVQTCVVNKDKRHAFVKMHWRKDAVAAKQGMESLQDDRVRSTRWGVGFGPRECSDYTSGISVIPIEALTDADRKWVVTAENGGTGGAPIEGGLVMEEPDIEIGAGVSSKAISRRMGPDHASSNNNNSRGRGNFGGNRGGNRGKQANNDHGRGRNQERQQNHHQQAQQHQPQASRRPASPRQEANTIGVPPPVPGFGFQLPGFPPNFG